MPRTWPLCSLIEPVRGLGLARAQARVTRETAHRPWRVPAEPWVMGQTWDHLLFAHWRVPGEALRRVVPPDVPLDVHDGAHWVTVTPFVVRALRPRALPPLPVGSCFAELNVRTYTTVGGRPGIWFLSLDAASRLAVEAARRGYRLPYFAARMRACVDGDRVEYRSERGSPPARFAAAYQPAGAAHTAAPGSVEHFLTERYCLYALDERRRVHRAEIHHPPWLLRPAQASIAVNTLGEPLGLDLSGPPDLLQLAGRQHVVFWRHAAVAT